MRRVALAQTPYGSPQSVSSPHTATVLPDCEHAYYVYPIQFDANKAGFSSAVFAKATREPRISSLKDTFVRSIYNLSIKRKNSTEMSGVLQLPLLQRADGLFPKRLCPTTEDLHFNKMYLRDGSHSSRTAIWTILPMP